MRTCIARLLFVFTAACYVSAAAQSPCDDPEADPWVAEMSERLLGFDQLAGYAIDLFGLPIGCLGTVTEEFDGLAFGVVALHFPDGVTFQMTTMPPETSIATLTDSTGFDDEPAMRDVVKAYATDIGLAIDWESAEVTTAGDESIETYWDPDEGLNASARFIFVDSSLVTVRVSLAL